jgi:hypothetical protein
MAAKQKGQEVNLFFSTGLRKGINLYGFFHPLPGGGLSAHWPGGLRRG